MAMSPNLQKSRQATRQRAGAPNSSADEVFGTHSQKQTFGLVVMSATFISTPSLSTFADKKQNDTEGGHRIYPPCTNGKLQDESCDHDKGEPAASDAFDCIGLERSAAKRFGKVKLTAGKEIHYRN